SFAGGTEVVVGAAREPPGRQAPALPARPAVGGGPWNGAVTSRAIHEPPLPCTDPTLDRTAGGRANWPAPWLLVPPCADVLRDAVDAVVVAVGQPEGLGDEGAAGVRRVARRRIVVGVGLGGRARDQARVGHVGHQVQPV